MAEENIHLEAILIANEQQVELLRRVRNATASGFSHDNTQISEIAQRAWWVVNRRSVRAWLYYHAGTLVGYGMLRQIPDGTWWNSLAVLPRYQGHGFGSTITHDLLQQSDEPVYASVRENNAPAIAMHRVEDWDRTFGPDESLVYFKSRL